MLVRLFLLCVLAGVAFSCDSNESFIDDLPLEPEAIADKIASTNLFLETSSALKEQHLLILSDVQNGATILSESEAADLDNSKDISSFLRMKNYQNAEQIEDVFTRSESLRLQMINELSALKAKIGDEKFAQVDKFLSTKYASAYKVSSDEALSLIKK